LHESDEGYLVQAGSDNGHALAALLALVPVTAAQQQDADREVEDAARRQTRRLPSRNLRDDLFANLAHPRWEEVAGRCLSCGNCTAVCPTCFCHSSADETALDGHVSLHLRQWDSCFTQGHSYIHGMTIRADTRMRYRQWLTHKLGSWHDQYGRSGCVGCGRCIAWCPVGIDITEEAAAVCDGVRMAFDLARLFLNGGSPNRCRRAIEMKSRAGSITKIIDFRLLRRHDRVRPGGREPEFPVGWFKWVSCRRNNPHLPVEAEVVERIQESPTIFTLRLRFTDPVKHAAFSPSRQVSSTCFICMV
jgi:ferredoxin